jgi:hypothetical protein
LSLAPLGRTLLEDLEYAAIAAAADEATAEQRALLEEHRGAWVAVVERLLVDTEEQLESVRRLTGEERDQVVADFEEERNRYAVALYHLTDGARGDLGLPSGPQQVGADQAGEVQLQLSWSSGDRLVAWGAGPGTQPATEEELAELLATAGAPTIGWSDHQPIPVPGGGKATARAIPLGEALGWLVAVAAGQSGERADRSVAWFGHLAAWGVQLVARGSIVPMLRTRRRSRSGKGDQTGTTAEHVVQWMPALADQVRIDEVARAMPGPVAVLDRSDPRNVAVAVVRGVVDAIATDAARRVEHAAPPPKVSTTVDAAEAVLTRLDGSPFDAPARAGAEVMRRLERWAPPVAAPPRAQLVVSLDPPDGGNAWFLSVLGPNPDTQLVPVEIALVDGRSKQHLAKELVRLERLLPVLLRPGGLRRGQVYLSSDEAWELMTVTGPQLVAAGFEVRVPALSRRKPAPALRLDAEPRDPSVVGANQLSQVRWSAVFDDVELTVAQITELAAQARPLVRSRGRWVELDKADLAEAAAALAERADRTQMTGAEVLRAAMGLDEATLGGSIEVRGSGWAADLLARAGEVSTEPVARPEGFEGELRSYQAEGLAWLGFLDSVELGGCLALDMGLGKTPTMLAHLARTAGNGPALVIAPPAVVGNWAAEAARFTPGLQVVVHHGAQRADADQLEAEVAAADVIITTYGTAVRDIDALSARPWDRLVLDEAQAIKNPANETAQQLRRIDARVRVALTGTPIENGLGDLWAILDFCNPGLLGSRRSFVSQLTAESENRQAGAERALRALNGILVFRRTKAEPEVARELPERIDQLDHCTMTPEQIGLYQAVLDRLLADPLAEGEEPRKGAVLAAITALKQICNHPAAYQRDGTPLHGRSGKLTRLEQIVDAVFEADERVLIFTHFAEWGVQLSDHLSKRTGKQIDCYHGGLPRGVRDRMVQDFQQGEGAGALVLSLKAGGTGLNLTAASHVVLYDRWWNPAVEDQARDRAWRIGQTRTVVSHRLVCPGTVDERVEEVVAGKRHIADLVLPKSSSLADLGPEQLRSALGLRADSLLTEEPGDAIDATEAA